MKKGFTLIELILVIALISIIVSMEFDIFFYSNKNYKKDVKEDKYYFYSTEALMFIQSEINENTDYVQVAANKINIYKIDGKKNVIAFKDTENKIGIYYYENGKSKGNNNIVSGIKDFTADQKDSVAFIAITTINGKKLERCFKIRTQI